MAASSVTVQLQQQSSSSEVAEHVKMSRSIWNFGVRDGDVLFSGFFRSAAVHSRSTPALAVNLMETAADPAADTVKKSRSALLELRRPSSIYIGQTQNDRARSFTVQSSHRIKCKFLNIIACQCHKIV